VDSDNEDVISPVILFHWKGSEVSIPSIWEELVEFSFTGVMVVQSYRGNRDSEGRIYIHLGYPMGASYKFMKKRHTIEGARALVYILEDVKHHGSMIHLIGQEDVLSILENNRSLMILEDVSLGRFKWGKGDLTLESARTRESAFRKETIKMNIPVEEPPGPERDLMTKEMVKMMHLIASEWFSAGYKVNRMMRILNDPRSTLEEMRREFLWCEERIRELKRYEAGLRSLEVDDPEDAKRVSQLIHDLKDLDTLEKTARNAESLMSEIQMKRASRMTHEEAIFRLTLATEWRERIRAGKLEELYRMIISRLGGKEPEGKGMGFCRVPEISGIYSGCTSGAKHGDVVIIVGSSGSGKTRILSEIMEYAVSRGIKVNSWVIGTQPPEGEADLYLIDGLERIGKVDEKRLCERIDSVISSKKGRIVITSSLRLEEMKFANDETLEKLAQGHVYEIPPLSFDSRVELLRRRGEYYGFDLQKGVLAYIARVRRGNIRALLLAVDKVIAMSLLLKKEIDIDFVKETVPESTTN